MTNATSRLIRFGPYEADFHTQELRKHGVQLKLSGQPLQVLEVLLARPGQLVTRTELQQLLWPGQVFVDASHGLNAAVNRLREALCDSASEPRYIETLPRRGYRFIGTLEAAEKEEAQPARLVASAPLPQELAPEASQGSARRIEPSPAKLSIAATPRWRPWMFLSTAAALVCVIGLTMLGLAMFASRHFNRAETLAQILESWQRKSADDGAPQPRVPQNADQPKKSSAEAELRKKSAEKTAKLYSVAPGTRVEDRGEPPTSPADYVVPAAANEGPLLRPALHSVISGDSNNAGPQFSPDGKHIAFMSTRNGSWQIWVSNVDGSLPRQVSFTESAGTPRWSPDGRSIAFDAPFDGTTWVFVVRLDQSDRAQPMVQGLVPSFSRDGKWIYFASERTGDWQVWKTPVRAQSPVGGSEVRRPEAQVTFHGGFAALESTDGFIYYSKSRYPEPEICRVRIQGGEESCSLQHLRPRTWASWAPTRGGIVFAEDLPSGQPVLSIYDPARQQVRDLVRLQSAPFWVGATIDGKKAMFNDSAERQISMVDNLP